MPINDSDDIKNQQHTNNQNKDRIIATFTLVLATPISQPAFI
jgi:hypothetical protein